MKSLIVALSLYLNACNLTQVNRATLITSTASLICDWGQTRSVARSGWDQGRAEANPIMGSAPSVNEVDTYFLSTVVINSVIWALMPRKYKSVIAVGVTAFQADTIYKNTANTNGICGISK